MARTFIKIAGEMKDTRFGPVSIVPLGSNELLISTLDKDTILVDDTHYRPRMIAAVQDGGCVAAYFHLEPVGHSKQPISESRNLIEIEFLRLATEYAAENRAKMREAETARLNNELALLEESIEDTKKGLRGLEDQHVELTRRLTEVKPAGWQEDPK